jgi:NitT/TauT family transport system ATP-binding protein
MTAARPSVVPRGVSVAVLSLQRRFNGRVVLPCVDLAVDPGEFVALIGPSGCGKSTLLRLIAGLDHPDFGSIAMGADPWPVGYVFQDACLMPWRTVLANVELPLELTGRSRAERRAAAERHLRTVGLAEAAERYPNELSGGMRMRVSLARALITEPRLLLLDEPFAALDALTRQHLDEYLQDLFLQHRMTVVFVTHSIPEAVFLADRVVVMSRTGELVGDRRIASPRPRHGRNRTEADYLRDVADLSSLLEQQGARA